MKTPAAERRGNALDEAADEATPLLGAATPGRPNSAHIYSANSNGQVDHVKNDDVEDEEKPMPYIQILVLCYASLAEPVGYFAIFPFISEMIQRNGGLRESDIGFWAGLIESLFSVVQMMLMVFYGRMSDRYGRKPVLVFSLAGISLGTTLFGFSRTLWQMILFRCTAGLFAGSVVTTRTMISENTTKLTQGRAFSWYMFTRNMGIFIGPLIGGGLANPTIQFPDTFGHFHLFKDYPYAFPTIVTGAFTMSGAMMCFMFLNETLVESKQIPGKSAPAMSTRDILRTPGVPLVLYLFGHIMFLAFAYTAVSPVFYYTSISKGGWRLTTSQTSYVYAISGISQAVWTLVVFPPLERRIGCGGVLRICGAVWPIFMAMLPVSNEILRLGLPNLAVGLAVPTLIVSSGVAMSFAAIQLCINNISPSPAVLGTVNALGLTITSGVRAVAPALFTSIYATGVKLGWAHGHLVWFIFVFLALTSNIPMYFLPKEVGARPETKPATRDAEDGSINDESAR